MRQSSKVIGFYGFTTQEIANRVLTGMLRYSREQGGLDVCDFRVPSKLELAPRSPPWQGRTDGVVAAVGLSLGKNDRETADWLLSGGVPVVSASGDWSDIRIPRFRVNRRSLAKLASEHLLACQCQSYIYVGFTGSKISSAARCLLFAQALMRHGHKVTQVDIASLMLGWSTDTKLVRGERKLIQVLRRLKKPLGVWTLNDYIARSICTLCADLKLSIPDDVRILGVDDLVVSRSENPSLSSIHTPGEQIGYMAMQALHGMLEGKKVRHLTEVPAAELVVRESTVQGIPPASEDLQETLQYIARHACPNLPVRHLSRRLHKSHRAFELKFRALVGHSALEEIKRVRLERAKELLWESQLSIKTIGHFVGFKESTDFCKFFRKETGLSPLEYRAGAGR